MNRRSTEKPYKHYVFAALISQKVTMSKRACENISVPQQLFPFSLYHKIYGYTEVTAYKG